MSGRAIQEQKLTNWLFKAKLISDSDVIRVIKLDWNQPFSVLCNGEMIGTVEFNGFIYTNFVSISKRRKYSPWR